MHSIYKTYQRKDNTDNIVASTRLDTVLYDSMIRCAELNGYSSVSSFLHDAVIDKCSSVGYALISLCNDRRDESLMSNSTTLTNRAN